MKYKDGDKVRCVKPTMAVGVEVGSVYTILGFSHISDFGVHVALEEVRSTPTQDVFEMVESKPKFKVGDKVRCVKSAPYITVGAEYTVVSACQNGYWYRVVNDVDTVDGYTEDTFELVQEDAVLTPEEVFEHLRKGTKLQWRYKSKDRWQECVNTGTVQVRCILDGEWRIKPEPAVIELNGKKYIEITE